jgi:3-hydroxyacyl-[acyl-carrier-protein] dehydratase
MLTGEEILNVIPHRFPMLMVDRVIELDPEVVSAVSVKNVSHGDSFFHGHFPGRPIMPGVLIIEAMAQTALLCIFGGKVVDPASEFLFAGIDKAKFRRAVVPGDQLRIEVKLIRRRRTFWKIDGVVSVDGESVAEAVFTAVITPPPEGP